MLSYGYPPLAAPESYLAAKAVAGLNADVDVVCCTAARPWQPADDSLTSYAEAAARQVERFDQPAWLPVVQPLRVTRRFPDAMRFVHRRAAAIAERRLAERDYDLLLTWSQWHSVHLVGLKLKRHHPKLPWLAHMSDPWASNPLVPLGPFTSRLNLAMERTVIREADAVEFTADEAAVVTMARHPAEWSGKAVTVPHAYDPALYPPIAAPSGSITIRYVGSFYGARSPRPLLDALERIRQRDPGLLDDVRVEMIGQMPKAVRASIPARIGAAELVTGSMVSYAQSLSLMAGADLLVGVDAAAARSVFLPSKLVDYIGAGRPILSIAPAGPAARLAREIGGWAADPGFPERIATAIAEALSAVRASRGCQWGDDVTRRRFHVSAIGEQRSAIIDRMIAGEPLGEDL